MTTLFSPLTLRGVTLRNRAGVSPMCMYSATDGHPDSFHLIHLGSRALGGAGLVVAEATAVSPEGRITPGCTGIWDDSHVESWAPIAAAIAGAGAVPGIQLQHAGRKAGTSVPWEGDAPLDRTRHDWTAVAPSAIAFADNFPVPTALDDAGIQAIIGSFAAAAERAVAAGFRLVKIHGAHGYLLHSFHSPVSNARTDQWGGSLENRTRLTREVVRAVRAAVGEDIAVSVRLSATDWLGPDAVDATGAGTQGWTVEESTILAGWLADDGADLIDCSSGGIRRGITIPTGPGYQVGLAAQVRTAGIPTAAVGQITDPVQAETILATGQADMVLLARGSLRDPYWALHAAQALGATEHTLVPKQYRTAY